MDLHSHRYWPSAAVRGCEGVYHRQSAAAAAVGIISTAGNISAFVSPYLFAYLKTRTGSFAAGLWAVAAVAFTGAMLTLSVPKRPEPT